MNCRWRSGQIDPRGKITILVLLLLMVSLVFMGSLAAATELPLAKPEEVGMSSEILDTIKPAMIKMLERKRAPGVVILVARKVILFSQVAPNRHLKMHYTFQRIAIKALKD